MDCSIDVEKVLETVGVCNDSSQWFLSRGMTLISLGQIKAHFLGNALISSIFDEEGGILPKKP